MGLRHPNPDIPEMRMATDARRVSDELGLTGKHVFFNEGWVPYSARQDILLDAQVGVSTHLQHIETEFSYRTRILDYLWAGMPVIATQGDALGELIEARGLGLTVAAGDVDGLAAAIERVATDAAFAAACRSNIEAVVPELRWSAVASPLVEFCRAPARAPDLADPVAARRVGPHVRLAPRRGWRREVHVGVRYVQEGGVRLLVEHLISRVLRTFGLRRGV
jgi:hypothetical protein